MINFFPSGDSAFLLKFGEEISVSIHEKIRGFCLFLEANPVPGILELVPGYGDVLVYYDPLIISYEDLLVHLKNVVKRSEEVSLPKARIVRIPVCYGGEFGGDMEVVMRHSKASEEEVIQIHSSQTYLVHMLGFTPGFCYLGGMDQRLATPRKDVPSTRISSGAVGIAGGQTGIYPIDSPGGWQIIGRTPLKLFRPDKEEPFLIRAGDALEFFPIDQDEYQRSNEHGEN